jgi:preprotein translocase subunit SecE
MVQTGTGTVTREKGRKLPPRSGPEGGSAGGRPQRSDGGWLKQYKPDQGKYTRTGTLLGLGLLIVWGAWAFNDRLVVYEGDEAWRLLITPGIAILLMVVLGVLAWRVAFVGRKSSDFMIGTEGEMKKVSWSSKREVIGSTKVVIVFTILLAVLLATVDLFFTFVFKSIGVLKV